MYIFFMAVLPHSEIHRFRDFLVSYLVEDSEYIISMETSPSSHAETAGQHFHVAVEMEDKSYDCFRKTILVNHYGLRGRASKGKPRQYGKVREIRDFNKFMSYTVKDQNLIHNMKDLKKLQRYIDQSFKREDKATFIEGCLEHIASRAPPVLHYDSNYTSLGIHTTGANLEAIEKLVLEFYIKQGKKVPVYATLKHITLRYLAFNSEVPTDIIYNYLRCK